MRTRTFSDLPVFGYLTVAVQTGAYRGDDHDVYSTGQGIGIIQLRIRKFLKENGIQDSQECLSLWNI
jgi:hypothetical protein